MPLPPWSSDLPALDLLLSVAETGSVGAAARRHGRSQPTVSARLTRLERELGVPLLVRTRQGSTLTPAGEAVVAWARDVVDAAHVLADGVRSLRLGRRARLRVAASLTVAEYLLPAWLLALRRRHPDLDIAADVANSRDVLDAVRHGHADVGFVETPDMPGDLSAARIGDDRLVLVVGAGYPLAARTGPALRPGDLLDLPLLLREPGSGTRDTFLSALGRHLTLPDVLAHATVLGSTATILAAVRAGGGVGVVSARAARAGLATGEVVAVDVPGLDLDRPLHAVWQGSRPPPLADDLLRVVAAAGRGAGR